LMFQALSHTLGMKNFWGACLINIRAACDAGEHGHGVSDCTHPSQNAEPWKKISSTKICPNLKYFWESLSWSLQSMHVQALTTQ